MMDEKSWKTRKSNKKIVINELSIKISSSDSFVTMQYLERQLMCDNPNVKESKPTCENLYEMMQCHGRQHCAARNDLHEHQRRHSSWKDSMKMEYSKMRSESSDCTWKAKAIWIHLESSEKCAQEVWERNWMSLNLHTTWWNVKIRKLMVMILMVFREQSEEHNQMNTVRTPVNLIPETLCEWEPTLEERGGFWE